VKTLDAVTAATGAAPGALYVASLGSATSALRVASGDGPHLYLGGAMGCGLAAAIGVAERCPDRDVVAVLGDGDLLMGAGSLWSLSGLRPGNLLALVLDDGRYSITGGQHVVDPDALAAAAGGFPGFTAASAADPAEVAERVRTLPRPAVVVAAIDEPEWPGASPFVDPGEVRARFLEHVRSGGH
jgi:thiamine pyrophosphate-dependent acetolactate synthase large subunit-like protein